MNFNIISKKIISNTPLILETNNHKHMIAFKKLLELAMTVGVWNGRMALVS